MRSIGQAASSLYIELLPVLPYDAGFVTYP